MVAFLLERHGGRLPFWLAPVQVCLLPVSDAGRGSARPGEPGSGRPAEPDAGPDDEPGDESGDGQGVDEVEELAADLRARGLRVRVEREGSLGNRIRLSRQRRDALLGVLGPREVESGVLAVTDPASGVKAAVPLADLGDRLAAAAKRRVPRVDL
jgi:threonyl-tRNA synthetase